MPTALPAEEEEPTVESLWTCKEFKSSNNKLGFHQKARPMIPKLTQNQTWSSTSLRMTRVSEKHLDTKNFSTLQLDKSLNATKSQSRKVFSKSLNQISNKLISQSNHTLRYASQTLSSVKRINRKWILSKKWLSKVWKWDRLLNNRYTLIKINKMLIWAKTKNKLKQHNTALLTAFRILKIMKHLYRTKVSEQTHLWSLGFDSSVEVSRNDLRKFMDPESTASSRISLSNWLKISSQQSKMWRNRAQLTWCLTTFTTPTRSSSSS